MTKPVMVLRNEKGTALTHTEHDQNFERLRDSTISIAVTGSDTVINELNGTTTLTSVDGIELVADALTNEISLDATLVKDTSPELAASLDANNFDLTDVKRVVFNTSAELDHLPNSIWWDPIDGTLNIGMGYDEVTQQVGLETYYHIKNTSGVTINNGDLVMATGTVGNSGQITGAKAVSNGSVNPRYIIGVATMTIANGADGYVTAFGLVRGINTTGTSVGETWADGDVLWANPSVVGGLTKVEPTAPNPKVVCALVVKADSNVGSLFVRLSSSFRLGDLQDVNVSTPADNDYLSYDSATSRWVNGNLNIQDDGAPTLGADLDTNNFAITNNSGNVTIKPTFPGSAIDLSSNSILLGALTGATASIDATKGGGAQQIRFGGGITLSTQGGNQPIVLSTSAETGQNIVLAPGLSNKVVIDGISWPTTIGSQGQTLVRDGAQGLLWQTVTRQNHVIVRSASDLPVAVGGIRQLADNTLYEINGTIIVNETLRYGVNTEIIGVHLGNDVIVYTGTGTAITASNVNFFMDQVIVVATNGTGINVTGTTSNEFMMEWCGIVASTLGTITGYNVPTIVNCNFEMAGSTAGLTFAGTSNKIFVSGCPFKDIPAGVSAVTFASSMNTAIVDFESSYFKTSNLTAVGITLVSGATVSGYGLMRGNTFLEMTNPVVGFGPETLGWDFKNNSPIRDSRNVGEIFMTTNTTATVLTTNTWTKIAGTTTAGKNERFDTPVTNRIRFIDSRRDAQGVVVATMSILGSVTNQVVECAIYKNGVIASAPIKTLLTGTTRADSVAVNCIVDFDLNDFVEVWIRCTSGNQNATVESLQMTVNA